MAAILKGKTNYGKLGNLAKENLGIKTFYKKILEDEIDLTEFPDSHDVEENIKDTTLRFYHAGSLLLHTSKILPFGTFVRHFINLTNSVTFDSQTPLKELANGKKCNSFSQMEKVLHEIFVDFGYLLGLPKNMTISIFDLPSLVSLIPEKTYQHISAKEAFLNTNCKNDLKFKVRFEMSNCWAQWNDYIQDSPNGNLPKCANVWTKNLDWESVMIIQRLAKGRGNNIIGIEEVLKPFKNYSKYEINPVGLGYYFNETFYDSGSWIQRCSYAGKDKIIKVEKKSGEVEKMHHCNLFQPVLTDFGICHSFNAKNSVDLLKDSEFKSIFQKVYQPDLIQSEIEKGIGAGSNLALDFVLDNGDMMSNGRSKNGFQLGISSFWDVFDLRSSSIQIKPGYKYVINVYPVEVKAKENLREVSIEKRTCRFHDEYDDIMEFFNFYSNSACKKECMLKQAQSICGCTPWNMPFPPKSKTMCDLYGHTCFDKIMEQQYR